MEGFTHVGARRILVHRPVPLAGADQDKDDLHEHALQSAKVIQVGMRKLEELRKANQ